MLAQARLKEPERGLQFLLLIGYDLKILVGKLPHAIGKGGSPYVAAFEELVGEEAVKRYDAIHEDLKIDLHVIVMDIDLGYIGRILRSGEIIPILESNSGYLFVVEIDNPFAH